MRTERVSLHQDDSRPRLVWRVRLATTEKLDDYIHLSAVARDQEVMREIQRTLE